MTTTDVRIPPPRAASGDAARKFAALRAGLVLACGAIALFLGMSFRLPGVPMCAFKLWTGYPCPGCGMTRSLVRLAHADLAESFRYHPLGIVVGVLAAAVLAGGIWGVFRGRDPVWRVLDRRGTAIGLAFVAALVGIWVVRAVVVPDWSPDPIGRPFAADR